MHVVWNVLWRKTCHCLMIYLDFFLVKISAGRMQASRFSVWPWGRHGPWSSLNHWLDIFINNHNDRKIGLKCIFYWNRVQQSCKVLIFYKVKSFIFLLIFQKIILFSGRIPSWRSKCLRYFCYHRRHFRKATPTMGRQCHFSCLFSSICDCA